MLIVANSETLQKVASYTDELTTLSWPSHVAVLDEEHIFIRDNAGVYRFNSGIEKSKDGHLWVATTGSPHKISKINSTDYSLIRANEITVGTVASGVFATPGITTKGDTIYYGGSSMSIYRHIFTTGDSEEMINKAELKALVPDATMVYNSMAVHPITGRVYLNTIKGYGWDFKINNISVFDFDDEAAASVLHTNYRNYTSFPAGIFFPYNFK